MANIDRPRGFRPVNPLRCTYKMFSVDSSNGNAIAPGDTITMESDGNVTRSSAGDGVNICGIVVAAYDSNMVPQRYLAASTAGYVLAVLPTPGTLFVVQADGDTSAADVGATADHVDTAPNTTLGISQQELDSSDAGTGNQLRIVGKVDSVDNDWGTNVDLIVEFAESMYQSTTSI